MSFLEGLKALELNDFSELDVACLMNILAKPQLENAILVEELVAIMENFGIVEGEMNGPEDMQDPPAVTTGEGEVQPQDFTTSQQSASPNNNETDAESKPKKKVLDFSVVGPAEIFYLREFGAFLKV